MPEFCFLQMADVLGFEDLLMLGFEFCGYYSILEEGMVNCTRLTAVDNLVSFIQRNGHVHGARKALLALRHIIEGAASPRESATAALLSLPLSYGGYGIPKPRLNHPVSTAMPTGAPVEYLCDLYWPQGRLAVEYNSDAHHAAPSQIARDARKHNALESSNTRVVTVTNQQIGDVDQFDQVARQVAKHLGVRLRKDRTGSAWQNKRARLRKSILLL